MLRYCIKVEKIRKKEEEENTEKRKANTLLSSLKGCRPFFFLSLFSSSSFFLIFLLGASVPPRAESDFYSPKPESRGVIENLIVVRTVIMLVT